MPGMDPDDPPVHLVYWSQMDFDVTKLPFFASAEDPTRQVAALELLAIVTAITLWGERLSSSDVAVFVQPLTDSETSVKAGARRYSPSSPLLEILRELAFRSVMLDLGISLRHFPGVRNWLADEISRGRHTELSLDPALRDHVNIYGQSFWKCGLLAAGERRRPGGRPWHS